MSAHQMERPALRQPTAKQSHTQTNRPRSFIFAAHFQPATDPAEGLRVGIILLQLACVSYPGPRGIVQDASVAPHC
jgi:hypothetical protein